MLPWSLSTFHDRLFLFFVFKKVEQEFEFNDINNINIIYQYLTDNKDFCVVGVVGGQGVGKSTIASMLAGARPTGARRSYMFWLELNWIYKLL